jgi:LPXTG-motif cell wall-anchored protein
MGGIIGAVLGVLLLGGGGGLIYMKKRKAENQI